MEKLSRKDMICICVEAAAAASVILQQPIKNVISRLMLAGPGAAHLLPEEPRSCLSVRAG